MEKGREGGRERGKGGREGGREGGRQGRRERGREGAREGGSGEWVHVHVYYGSRNRRGKGSWRKQSALTVG